jgi:predicted nucleic acid-binding Zn ribbon protein
MDKRKLPKSEEHKRKISEAQKGKARSYLIGNKYRLGKTPWNKGKTGIQVAWNKGLKKCLNTGKTHIKKGQHLSVKTEFGNKPAWNKNKVFNIYSRGNGNYQKFRKEILERDKFQCVNCGVESKVVHHIKKVKLFPNLKLDKDNAITLCSRCHGRIHRLEQLTN